MAFSRRLSPTTAKTIETIASCHARNFKRSAANVRIGTTNTQRRTRPTTPASNTKPAEYPTMTKTGPTAAAAATLVHSRNRLTVNEVFIILFGIHEEFTL